MADLWAAARLSRPSPVSARSSECGCPGRCEAPAWAGVCSSLSRKRPPDSGWGCCASKPTGASTRHRRSIGEMGTGKLRRSTTISTRITGSKSVTDPRIPEMLRIENLSKTYGNGVHALKDVSLEIPRGMFGLLGPNGAGKSTLMRTIATLQGVDAGNVFFDPSHGSGQAPSHSSGHALDV